MKKGKQGQGWKKAPSPEVNDKVKEDDEDDEMQLKNIAKINNKQYYYQFKLNNYSFTTIDCQSNKRM